MMFTMDDHRRLRVLISAYACEPGRGSEQGVGWNWVLQAAQDNDVTVLTRSNQRAAIESGLASFSGNPPHFVYLENRVLLPFKRKGRGARWYYYFWQFSSFLVGRRLHKERRFDLVHHL